MNEVVCSLMHHGAPRGVGLAVLPAGTANDFASALGISMVCTPACAMCIARVVCECVMQVHAAGWHRQRLCVSAGDLNGACCCVCCARLAMALCWIRQRLYTQAHASTHLLFLAHTKTHITPTGPAHGTVTRA